MRYLSQVTSMSPITLDVAPEVDGAGGSYPGGSRRRTTRRHALLAFLQDVATGAIWFVIYILPILAMLGIAVVWS